MKRLTVISLGGGVQSSVMALMASAGAFDSVPDCAVFADTHWEPPSLYTHLEWLAGQLRFPLHVVDNGRSLREDVKGLTNHSGSRRYVDIPVYLKGRDGESNGMGRRQCTDNYKIRPVRRKVRELLGLRRGQRVPSGVGVELWLSISTEEAIRMKTSRDRWMANRYPLIGDSEEKGSDVNLAIRLLVDGFNGGYEQAVVVSNDADFAGAMRYVRDDLGLRITLVNPDARNASPRELADAATYVKRLWKSHLRRSLLPDTLRDEIGTIRKPDGWRETYRPPI